jgi:hypothetical protein
LAPGKAFMFFLRFAIRPDSPRAWLYSTKRDTWLLLCSHSGGWGCASLSARTTWRKAEGGGRSEGCWWGAQPPCWFLSRLPVSRYLLPVIPMAALLGGACPLGALLFPFTSGRLRNAAVVLLAIAGAFSLGYLRGRVRTRWNYNIRRDTRISKRWEGNSKTVPAPAPAQLPRHRSEQ